MRQVHCQLIVEHILVEIPLLAAEQRLALAEALVRLTHALEQHLREQTLELLRDFLERGRVLRPGIALECSETFRVGVEGDGRRGHGSD